MQVSHTASALQAPQKVNQQTQPSSKTASLSVEQEKQQKSKQQNRFDVDEQALILAKQSRDLNSSSTSRQGFQSKHADYDQPSQHNQTAVSTYQSVSNLSQRENIQQIFGVDLLA